MPLALPTRDDLRTQTRANLQARIPNADMSLRFGVLPVISNEIADVNYLEIRAINNQYKQLFPDTAESTFLARFAALFGIERIGASPAAGNVIFEGTAGTIDIPLNTLLQTSGGAVTYQTQLDATVVAGGTVDVPVLALTPGSAGNASAGAYLPLVVAIAGVAAIADVDSAGLTGGLDTETDAALLVRTLARIQAPPQGGDATDYVAWAKLVPGVTRAWVYPARRGLGTVDVAFVLDARTNILPLSGDVTAVQASINANRPVTADSQALTLTGTPIPVTLRNTVYALGVTLTVGQAAVQAALAALFATATPGGASVGDGVDSIHPAGILDLDEIYAAIASAAGMVRFDLIAPTADIASTSTQIATLGAVTFT